jgi:aryl-alcohol dehydrogenase-like predicted oxidoreductase
MMKFRKGENSRTRNLGNANIAISPIALGCIGMSHAYGDEKDEANLTVDEMTTLVDML